MDALANGTFSAAGQDDGAFLRDNRGGIESAGTPLPSYPLLSDLQRGNHDQYHPPSDFSRPVHFC